MGEPTKMPDYGGGGGKAFDDFTANSANPPVSVRAITVRAGKYVDRLEPAYALTDGSTVSIPHGGTGGSSPETIALAANEKLVGIKGRSGKYLDQISFVIGTESGGEFSDSRTVGPYGGSGGDPFEIWGETLAFYGRSGSYVDALGSYVEATTSEVAGGGGGSPFQDPVPVPGLSFITKIVIRSGDWIDAIATTYHLADGSERTFSHGGKGGSQNVISLAPGERIIAVEGSTGYYVYDIAFRTVDEGGKQRTYGPYGSPKSGFPFSVEGNVGAFFGRSGDYVDAIDFYLT